MVLSALCWSTSARRGSGLNRPVPGLTAIMAPSTPTPSLHSHVFSSAMEANSPNRQQCLAGVEGKLVREVKINNIPCCLQ